MAIIVLASFFAIEILAKREKYLYYQSCHKGKSFLPILHIGTPRSLVDDGYHNAFTDICHFNGALYLTYRRCPDGHMLFSTSRIVVMRSENGGTTWREVCVFGIPPRDVRDPHLLVFNSRLFVYSGTWAIPPEGQMRTLNDHLGFAVYSEDGESWSDPVALEGTYGHYIWRAATYGNRAYLCGRRRKGYVDSQEERTDRTQIECAMLESEDGLVWRYRSLFTCEYGDETAFLFEEDGQCLALARGADTQPARICRSHPPYEHWKRSDLDRNVGGPLLAKWGDLYLVGGRKNIDPQKPRTTLYWLIGNQLQEIGQLPSGGDNSYPGFIALDRTRALLSYYSSHEGSKASLTPSAIYLSELTLS